MTARTTLRTVRIVSTTLAPCPIPGATLRRLTPADAGQVTVLQRCCWVEEALTNELWWIPALRESVDEVAQWLADLEAWGLRLDTDWGPAQVAFIRAPEVVSYGPGVTPVATLHDRVVAVTQGSITGIAFHPELTGETLFHRRLLKSIG